MFSALFALAHLLLGGAFLVFGVRNLKSVPRLAGVLEKRKIAQPQVAAQIGVGLQLVGGALTVLAPFVPLLGVLGGLAMIVFLVLATVLFHPFWEYSGDDQTAHANAFIMNSGLTGAFLLVVAYGL